MQRLWRSVGHSRAVSVDISQRHSACANREVNAFVTEAVAGNRLNGIDKSNPLWFIPAAGKGICSGSAVEACKFIVLVDITLVHAEQSFKNTSQCAGSVRTCGAVEIHRLPVRYSIDHAPEVELPRCNWRQRVGCCLVGNRKPHIAAKR